MVDSEIKAQPPLTTRAEMRTSYGVSKEESTENKAYRP